MLKLRHRIIPIIYRDVSKIPDLDPNLRYILSSVTYVTWPKSGDQADIDAFWKSLKQSLPELPLADSSDAYLLKALNNNPKCHTNKALQCDSDSTAGNESRTEAPSQLAIKL